MNKKDKARNDLKSTLEKEHGRPISEEELDKVESFLKFMAEAAIDIALEDNRRQRKLKENPGGFHLDVKGYSCTICGKPASGENSWFDSHGLKCGLCQRGIDREDVPAWLGERKDEWYNATELEIFFSLKGAVLRNWIKKGLLSPRTIKIDGKGTHLLVFLIAENKAMLPPKNLLQGGTVKEVIEGREEYVFAPWYWFVDVKEHLKGYGIAEYLEVAPASKEG